MTTLLRWVFFAVSLGLTLGFNAASAAPFTPCCDQDVLEVLPARAANPRMRELQALRSALAATPRDADAAVRLARRYYDEVAAEGDPRYVGYAQAALAPWWTDAAPPVNVRVMRAILLQFSHGFDAALADLDAAVIQDPRHAEAWAWQAAIHLVQANYPAAGRACAQLQALAAQTLSAPLIATACSAHVDSLTGQGDAAVQTFQAALAKHPNAPAPQQLWVLTRLAETEERLGHGNKAEIAYRRALALNLTDGYLLAAYADFLLDQKRPAEVLVLLKDKSRSDLLLLRLALAAKAVKDPRGLAWQNDLDARFEAARLRGSSVHEKEESRFVLGLLINPRMNPDVNPRDSNTALAQRALTLAQQNYAVQREPADARILLEAALAAGQPEAAAPALQWMARSGIQSVALQTLTRQLKGAK